MIQNEEYSEECSDDSHCHRITSTSSAGKVYTRVNLKIGNRKLFIKIDTGSDVIIIDEIVHSFIHLFEVDKISSRNILIKIY